MRRIPLLAVSAVSATLAAGLFTAGPALAVTPAEATTFCPFPGSQRLPDGSIEFGVEANGAGCVVVIANNGGVALEEVVLAPGWTDEVKDSGDRRVRVRFTQPATGDRHEVRIEPGKTEVR